MSFTSSAISFGISLFISLVCFMLFASIAAPFRCNNQKTKKRTKIRKNNLSMIFHFSCICIFIVYVLPAMFYLFYNCTEKIIFKIIILLLNVVSIYIATWIMNYFLFKSKEKSLDNNSKNYIYLLTLIFAFAILIVFALLNIDSLKKANNDTDDFFEYMIAPFAALIGNIIPLKSMYSMNGAKTEIHTNILSEYIIEEKKDKHKIWLITGFSNIVIALFFVFYSFFERINAFLDSIHIVPIIIGIAVSSLLVRVFNLME